MADDITKEEFFQTLYKLDSEDTEDESIIDEGRLVSEAFLKNSIKGKGHTNKDPTVLGLGRGSSRSTGLPSLDQAERLRPSNTPQYPFTAHNMQHTVSEPLNKSPFGSSGRHGINSERKEPPSNDRSSFSPEPPIQLRHTTSVPIQISTSSVMVSSTAPKASAKRKRGSNTRQVPEGLRIFKDLHFCTIEAQTWKKRLMDV
jgi:hypothetical protein